MKPGVKVEKFKALTFDKNVSWIGEAGLKGLINDWKSQDQQETSFSVIPLCQVKSSSGIDTHKASLDKPAWWQ